MQDKSVFDKLGREAGCKRLAWEFYGRVAKDEVLKPLFPGKSIRCAAESLGAFLVQFFDGDWDESQYHSYLGLRESHARFKISEAQRLAWLTHMDAATEALVVDVDVRGVLAQFFRFASLYIVWQNDGSLALDSGSPAGAELVQRWQMQVTLDQLIVHILNSRDEEAMALANEHLARPTVLVGIFARMMKVRRDPLDEFIVACLERDHRLLTACFNGRTLMHFAAGAGCLRVVQSLLANGVNPDIADAMGHPPLYRVANECQLASGPEIVRSLVSAGARVDLAGGVTRSTPLHTAARRGNLEIAGTLFELGASLEARDNKGFTPLARAINCRQRGMAEMLEKLGNRKVGGLALG